MNHKEIRKGSLIMSSYKNLNEKQKLLENRSTVHFNGTNLAEALMITKLKTD